MPDDERPIAKPRLVHKHCGGDNAHGGVRKIVCPRLSEIRILHQNLLQIARTRCAPRFPDTCKSVVPHLRAHLRHTCAKLAPPRPGCSQGLGDGPLKFYKGTRKSRRGVYECRHMMCSRHPCEQKRLVRVAYTIPYTTLSRTLMPSICRCPRAHDMTCTFCHSLRHFVLIAFANLTPHLAQMLPCPLGYKTRNKALLNASHTYAMLFIPL
jgi:hypothetical protein